MKLPLPKAPINRQINKKNVAQMNQKLNQLSAQFKAALAQGKYEDARQLVKQVLSLVPNHVIALMDLAFTELKLERYEEAYQHYHQAIKMSQNSIDTNIYDGLAEVCHYLGKTEELKLYGARALNTKKAEVADRPILHIIEQAPPVFNPHNPQENIIAYSLFGNNPRYCETSVINVKLAKEIYPEWICRFYIDDSVPDFVVDRLSAQGAEVVYVSEEQRKISGLFWRFFVLDDPKVKRFLIRDADSLVSYREKAAVDAWLKSGKWFHTMRDYYSHTELILAGMWGGCTGAIRDLEQQIYQYLASGKYLTDRVADQHYLRRCIWPTIQQSVLLHDSQGFDEAAVDFPEYQDKMDYENFEKFHVGMNEGSSQVMIDVHIQDQAQVAWAIYDDSEHEICRYIVDVPKSLRVDLDLPRTYAEKLKTKEWKLLVHSLKNSD